MARIGEPVQTKTGWITRALPFQKWRRPYGLASMIVDRVALRLTLNLCASCEHKMPWKWEDRYNYAFVKGFHAEQVACDYCRDDFTATNMYLAVDGAYHQEMVRSRRSVRETRERERLAAMKDRRFLLNAW